MIKMSQKVLIQDKFTRDFFTCELTETQEDLLKVHKIGWSEVRILIPINQTQIGIRDRAG
jgi:hypothetical protein